MQTAQLLNLSGIGLQMLGLLIMSRINLLAQRHSDASDMIRETSFAEVYQAERDGFEYEPSTQENETAELYRKLQKAGRHLKLGLSLAILGTGLQLIGTAIS
jgi:hypothetical protein